MVPFGETTVVCEISCDVGDADWERSDSRWTERVVRELSRNLRLFDESEVVASSVVREAHAYPTMLLGYEVARSRVIEALGRIEGLSVIGRTGRFEYLDMDAAAVSGIEAGRLAAQRYRSMLGR